VNWLNLTGSESTKVPRCVRSGLALKFVELQFRLLQSSQIGRGRSRLGKLVNIERLIVSEAMCDLPNPWTAAGLVVSPCRLPGLDLTQIIDINECPRLTECHSPERARIDGTQPMHWESVGVQYSIIYIRCIQLCDRNTLRIGTRGCPNWKDRWSSIPGPIQIPGRQS
jgi:hypothetical protein